MTTQEMNNKVIERAKELLTIPQVQKEYQSKENEAEANKVDLSKIIRIGVSFENKYLSPNEKNSEEITNTDIDYSTCYKPFSIPEILEMIEGQIGLELKLCDYFTGIKKMNGETYFNVILNQRASESNDYVRLKRFSEQYNLIKIEPNGLNRVAIFSNGL